MTRRRRSLLFGLTKAEHDELVDARGRNVTDGPIRLHQLPDSLELVVEPHRKRRRRRPTPTDNQEAA